MAPGWETRGSVLGRLRTTPSSSCSTHFPVMKFRKMSIMKSTSTVRSNIFTQPVASTPICVDVHSPFHSTVFFFFAPQARVVSRCECCYIMMSTTSSSTRRCDWFGVRPCDASRVLQRAIDS